MEHLVTSIIGMHCATCAQNIEKVLSSTKGIISISVSFTAEHATISYDENVIDEKKIFRIIEKAGYVPEKNVPENEIQKKRKKLIRKWYKKTFLIGLLSFLIILSPFLTDRTKIISDSFSLFIQNNLFLFGITTVVFVIGMYDFLKESVNSIRTLKNNKTLLPSLGIASLFVYTGILTIFPNLSGEVLRPLLYLSIVLITLLLNIEKIINLKMDKVINENIEKLINLKSEKATVIRHNKEFQLEIGKIKIGDLIKVEPGQTFPVDGIIIEGKTTINEVVLTGFNPTIEKNPGDEVISATINISNPIIYKALQIGKNTTLSQALQILKDTRKYQGFFEKFGKNTTLIFTFITLISAIASLLIWTFIIGNTLGGLLSFTSILLIANPYIFKFSSESPIKMGLSRAAFNGILFKGSKILEDTNKIKRIVFDKTGTLTHGIPEITNIISKEGFNEKRLLIAICSLEHASLHPFGNAIVEYCKNKRISMKKVYNFKNIEGQGIMGTVDGQEIIAGNMKLMEASGVITNNELVHKADIMSKNVRTPIFIARNRELLGVIGVADSIRESTKDTILRLNKKGYLLTLITGDNEKIANNIAEMLRIRNVIADVTQKEKIAAIHQYQNKKEFIAFVGDGINDAPVLAAADIGMSIGTGTDTSLEASDITFISDNLENVNQSLIYTKSILKVIKQNYVFTFLYVFSAILVASGVLFPYFKTIMHPAIAPAAMIFSYVFIMKNSLKYKKYIYKERPKDISDFHPRR